MKTKNQTKNENVIEIKDLVKEYRIFHRFLHKLIEILFGIKKHESIRTLNKISFDVKKGEILGIIGKNGAGKSTLLKIISGVYEPTEGTVKISGKITSLLELGTSFNQELTGIENIYQQGRINGLNDKEIEKHLQYIIDFADIGDNINQKVKIYSSGMFARLAFATAIYYDFDILIIDEILSVGDISFQNKCIKKIKEFSTSGKTVIFVSHDMHSVKYFCDRIIRMDNGIIIDEGTNVIEIVERYENNQLPETLQESKEETYTKSKYAKIDKIEILNGDGTKTKKIKFKERFSIKVTYTMFEYDKGMFIGIGFRNSKGEYISGLNTKIDKFEMKQKPGQYTLTLEYKNPTLYKDTFILWAVIYNESGTVVLSDHIIKDAFEIISEDQYGEGVVLLEHQWKYEK